MSSSSLLSRSACSTIPRSSVSRVSGGIRSPRAASVAALPRIAVSGVRNSCETEATRSSRIRLASCSRVSAASSASNSWLRYRSCFS